MKLNGGVLLSIENVKLFFVNIKRDDNLQTEINQLYEDSEKTFNSELIQLGLSLGYSFNEEELCQFQQGMTGELQLDEIKERDLEQIAGGFASAEDLERDNPHLKSTWTKCSKK